MYDSKSLLALAPVISKRNILFNPKPKMVNQGLQLAGYLLGLMSGMVAKMMCVGTM